GVQGDGSPVDRATDVGGGRQGPPRVAQQVVRHASTPRGTDRPAPGALERDVSKDAAGHPGGRGGARRRGLQRWLESRPGHPAPATTTSTSTTSTTVAATTTTAAVARYALTGLPVDDPATQNRPALVVKIDNHPEARPQTGLNQADVVYEEMVEGITRFFAVF